MLSSAFLPFFYFSPFLLLLPLVALVGNAALASEPCLTPFDSSSYDNVTLDRERREHFQMEKFLANVEASRMSFGKSETGDSREGFMSWFGSVNLKDLLCIRSARLAGPRRLTLTKKSRIKRAYM